jgi:hypothetical protein
MSVCSIVSVMFMSFFNSRIYLQYIVISVVDADKFLPTINGHEASDVCIITKNIFIKYPVNFH